MSLTGCPIRPLVKNECLRWLKKEGPVIAFYGVMSSVSFIAIVVWAIHGKISCFWALQQKIIMIKVYLSNINSKIATAINLYLLYFKLIRVNDSWSFYLNLIYY